MYEKLSKPQRKVVDRCLSKKTLAVYAEQRTGKTWMTVAVTEQLMADSDVFAGLYVVPLTNKISTWVSTFEQELSDLKICTDWGEFKVERKKHSKIALVIHYEMLDKLILKLRRCTWSLITCDESQRIKKRSSKASRSMRKLRHIAEYKLLLTGTPFDKDPQEMWAQFRFLNPAVFGDRWQDFEDEYLYRTGFMGYKRKFKRRKLKKFLKKIKPWTAILEAKDVGVKKAKVINRSVDLVGPQRRLYDEMETEFVTEIGGTEVLADLKITQIIKCHQIAGGFIIDKDGNSRLLGRAKWKETLSILKENKPPAVIFCRYKHELFWLRKKLKDRYDTVSVLWGKIKDRKTKLARTELLNSFQEGKIDILLCQIRTGGVGVDLWAATCAIVWSCTHSSIDFEQMIARMNHMLRKKRAKVFLISARNTVDEDINLALRDKKDIKEAVKEGLRRRRKKT